MGPWEAEAGRETEARSIPRIPGYCRLTQMPAAIGFLKMPSPTQ